MWKRGQPKQNNQKSSDTKSQCLISETQRAINDESMGILCTSSSENCIHGGMRLSEWTLTQHAQVPGLFPSIREGREGERRKRTTSVLICRGIYYTQVSLWSGMEPRASCMLSTATELYHQPSALKVKMTKKIKRVQKFA